jgi:hypothetical protein
MLCWCIHTNQYQQGTQVDFLFLPSNIFLIHSLSFYHIHDYFEKNAVTAAFKFCQKLLSRERQNAALFSISYQASAKFGTCTILGLNGTLIEAQMFTFTLECTHFIFNKCPIQAHDGANAKFSPS